MCEVDKVKNYKVLIYTLSHPITKEIRYIGKTKLSLNSRLKLHLKAKDKGYRSNWVKSLLKESLIPVIEELEETDLENWRECERYWIAQFKVWGFRLTNLAKGGEGNDYFKLNCKKSIENIRKTKELHKGNKYNLGRKMTQHTKDMLKLGRQNRTEEQTKKINEKLSYVMSLRIPHKNSLKAIIDYGKFTRKIIEQYDLQGNFIKEWSSANEIEKVLGFYHSNVANCCKGKHKNIGGFIWKYKHIKYDKDS